MSRVDAKVSPNVSPSPVHPPPLAGHLLLRRRSSGDRRTVARLTPSNRLLSRAPRIHADTRTRPSRPNQPPRGSHPP
ncbi:MAG: hypothetical protein MZV64_17370 [Ignavibacteriales bacterium]|nr:hypothetical protein [Ignavibacteriales bacterium]